MNSKKTSKKRYSSQLILPSSFNNPRKNYLNVKQLFNLDLKLLSEHYQKTFIRGRSSKIFSVINISDKRPYSNFAFVRLTK